jgi:hypothetical protein
VTIRGDQLYSFVQVDLDSIDPPTIDRTVRVAVDDTWLGAADVTVIDATRIDVWIPGNLKVGPHDVTVGLAPNRSVRRAGALRVERDGSLADAGIGATDAGVVGVTSPAGPDGGNPEAGPGPAPTVCSEPSQCQPCIIASCFAYDTVRLIEAVSDSAEEDDPSFTADLLELYFNSDRNGVSEIWLSRRATPSEPWGAPELVESLSSGASHTQPNVSRDGLEIHFGRSANGTWRILRATRASRADDWSTPVRLSELNQPGDDYTGHVSAGGLEMLLHRREPGADTNLFRAVRGSLASLWGRPAPIAELNTTGGDAGPSLHISERQVFFDSNRSGSGDIYTALRDGPDAPFGAPVPVDSLNTQAPEEGLWISDDFGYAVMARQVAGNWELFEALR